MTIINWIFCVSLLATGLFAYLLGVQMGKRFERRHLTVEFHAVLIRLLHLAAKQDYKQLHLMLQDLVADREILDEIRQEEGAPENAEEQLERASRARMEREATVPKPPPDET